MKTLITLMLFLILATSSHAAEITEAEVVSFIQNWFGAQNTASFSDYADMYSKKFVGIRRSGATTKKLDYDAWLKERKRMFRQKMLVSGGVLKIKVSGATASVRFEQTWESSFYKDKGVKVLHLIIESEKLKIISEEMLFSEIKHNLYKRYNNRRIFTSIKDKDCKHIDSHKMIEFFGHEYVSECPAPKGWRLFKEYDSEGIRSWLRLSYGNEIWSTVHQVWGDEKYGFGHFPNVNDEYVEWRISKNGEPKALIFRIYAQDPDKASSVLTRLFVIGLADHIPRFCGIAKTNEEAINIADDARTCVIRLQKEYIPRSQL